MAIKDRHSLRRRRFEFRVLVHHVKKDKPRLIKRLQNMLTEATGPQGCFVWKGSRHYGSPPAYGSINFRYHGRHVQIGAHRLFLMLMLQRPIKVGYDAGHTCNNTMCCRHVTEQKSSANVKDRNERAHGDGVPF